MNNRKVHIIISWLLLLFFAVGQVVVYAHQHHAKYNALSFRQHQHTGQQIVQEKCNLCDQMHYAPIALAQPLLYTHLVASVIRLYLPAQHHYKANALIHADGLSPPAIV